MKTTVYKGVVNLLGHSTVNVTAQNKLYSVIELIDENEKIISLKNIIINLSLDNYLSLNEEVEIHTITSPVLGVFKSYNIFAIYSKKRGLNIEIPKAIKFSRTLNLILGIFCLFSIYTLIFSVFFFYLFYKRSKLIKYLTNEFPTNYQTSLK